MKLTEVTVSDKLESFRAAKEVLLVCEPFFFQFYQNVFSYFYFPEKELLEQEGA